MSPSQTAFADIKPVSWLLRHPGQLEAAAGLVYESFAEYYDLFHSSPAVLQDAIVQQLQEPQSEVGNTQTLDMDGEVCGIISWYPVEEMRERQLVSLRMLLDLPELAPDLFQHLQRYREQVPAISGVGLYLARLAVSPTCRRGGFGRRLLAEFEEQVQPYHCSRVCLHVRRDNEQALACYRACGYTAVSGAAQSYLVMVKD